MAAWSGRRPRRAVSDRLHPWIRSSRRPLRRPRPVVLNTWEAVYFDHDLPTLAGSSTPPPRVGVERFVLDDGWFRGRRDDQRGARRLDRRPRRVARRPAPAGRARARGRAWSFGLWVEPEMVSPDSDLARAHPDWVLGAADRPRPGAHQRVLDLAQPGAFAHVLERARRAARRVPDRVPQVGPQPRPARAGAAHRQTAALYRLLDALRAAHPGRRDRVLRVRRRPAIDLGILERVDRVWTSRHQRPARAPADPALDERARAARVPRRAPRRRHRAHHRAHLGARASGWRPRCSAAPASSGT